MASAVGEKNDIKNGSKDGDSQSQNFPSSQICSENLRTWMWQNSYWNAMNVYHQVFIPAQMMAWYWYNAQSTLMASNPPRVTVDHPENRSAPPGLANNPQPQERGGAPPRGPTSPGVFRARIPPVWRRIVAEVLDCMILLTANMFLTIFFIDNLMIDIMDMRGRRMNLDYLLSPELHVVDLDYVTAMALLSQLICMEAINRTFVATFEAICLIGSSGTGVGAAAVGGTTPGKRAMGLSVLQCDGVMDGQRRGGGGGGVELIGARGPTVRTALLRSFLKNFSMAFLFPSCLTIFLFDHRRPIHDILSQTVVVMRTNDD